MSTLTFPLSRDVFLGALPVSEFQIDSPEQQVFSQTRAGEVLRIDIGPRLWRGKVTVAPELHTTAMKWRALIDTLRPAGRSFFAYNRTLHGPLKDPYGTSLVGLTIQINSLNVDARQVSIKGLPAGFVLSPGDMLSWSYGTSPVRYALHQVVSGATASGGGVTPEFEVTPTIRIGAVVNANVELIRPYCKAVLVPGTVTPGVSEGPFTRDISFDWIQTLR